MEIGLCLGSNLGNRLANLQQARAEIGTLSGVEMIEQSPVYETEPVDVLPQHADKRFLNAVLILEGLVSPWQFAAQLNTVEQRMGRIRGLDRNEPRIIDIDILFMGRMRLIDGPVTLPHPRWATRRFVVQPLCNLRPDLVLPGEARTAREVLLSLPLSPAVQLFSEEW